MDIAEDGEVKEFPFYDYNASSIRREFIRKVYKTLACQLLVTLGVICFFTNQDTTQSWVITNTYRFTLTIALFVTIWLKIAMQCFESESRRPSISFPLRVFLETFTVGVYLILLGMVTASSAPEAVVIAVGISAAISLALMLFALQRKFTLLGGFLVCAIVSLLIPGIAAVFIRSNNIPQFVWGCAGAFLFSLYLVMDAEFMIGINNKYIIHLRGHHFAAINLYLDTMNMFLYTLALTNASSR